MKNLLHTLTIDTFVPMLRVLSNLLEKGAQHASAKKFDPNILVSCRLAPDMYPLAVQVQIACEHAVMGAARLMGVEVPTFERNEKTLDDLRQRVEKTLDYLKGATEDKFVGAEDRHISFAILNGDFSFEMNGVQYVKDWALPHFYFHVVTAYDILRHNGVELSKRDFVSHVGVYIRPRPQT